MQEGPYASRFTEPIRRRHRRAVPPLGCDDRAGVFAAPPHDCPAEAVGTTPRTADGHPDLTGVWNGLGDNLNGIPNQIANNGLSIEAIDDARSAQRPADRHVPAEHQSSAEQRAGRACGRLLRRVGSNRPVYKPEYWEMVHYLDHNSNERSVEQLHAGGHSARRHPVVHRPAADASHVRLSRPGRLDRHPDDMPHDSAGRPPAHRCRSSMERIPAKPSRTGRATRSSLIRGVQHQHLVRSDWRLLPQ